MTAPPRRPPASPCIGHCVVDQARGLCTGCARSMDEIVAWGTADAAFRDAVWADLPRRAAGLGLATRRLPWRGAAILDAVAARFAAGVGSFAAGVYGAVAEIRRDPDAAFTTHRTGETLTVTTPRGALRLSAPRQLAAFEVDRPEGATALVLALPRGRAGAAGPDRLTALGPDDGALLPRDAGGPRFDLGLGRRAARFTIRCDAGLADRLSPHAGTPWPDHLGRIAPSVIAHGPVRVIEAPGLRVEVDAPIPTATGTTPPGPHTHLRPDLVATGHDAAPATPLPERYVPVLTYHPD